MKGFSWLWFSLSTHLSHLNSLLLMCFWIFHDDLFVLSPFTFIKWICLTLFRMSTCIIIDEIYSNAECNAITLQNHPDLSTFIFIRRHHHQIWLFSKCFYGRMFLIIFFDFMSSNRNSLHLKTLQFASVFEKKIQII